MWRKSRCTWMGQQGLCLRLAFVKIGWKRLKIPPKPAVMSSPRLLNWNLIECKCLAGSTCSSSLLLSSLEFSDTHSLWAVNTSPPRNRCTFLWSICSQIENCTDRYSSQFKNSSPRVLNWNSIESKYLEGSGRGESGEDQDAPQRDNKSFVCGSLFWKSVGKYWNIHKNQLSCPAPKCWIEIQLHIHRCF